MTPCTGPPDYATTAAPFFLYLMDHGMVDAYCADRLPTRGARACHPA